MSTGLLRTEAVGVLARLRGDMLSIVTMRPVGPWNALGQADDRNFNVVGCMGSAAAVALGLALAQPRERILTIDGDGSLLMQLASLVSVAGQRPANLYHVVFENGVYETSGSQELPGRDVSDLSEIALASGYSSAHRFASVEEMESGLPQALTLQGPVFISLSISGPGLEPALGPGIHVANKPTQIENMRAALADSS